MRTEDVLDLISSAPKRYKSVRAAVYYQGHGPTFKRSQQRSFESEAGKQETSPADQQRPLKSDLPDGPFGWRCRVWFAGGARDGARFASEGVATAWNWSFHKRLFPVTACTSLPGTAGP